MAIFTPYFVGTYSGHLVYNLNNLSIQDGFKYYVENYEIVYDNIYDNKISGFSDNRYLQNTIDDNNSTGTISITLTNDLPHWLMQQLVQLSKACLKSGISLLFSDWITDENYYCKWDNAGEFSEISAVLCGGEMLLKFYRVGLLLNYQDTYSIVGTLWQDSYLESTPLHYQNRH